MRPKLRLCVPAFLAVSVIGAPGCNDGTKTTATEASETDTAAPTTGAFEPPVCYDLGTEAECEADEYCAWVDFASECFSDCPKFETKEICLKGTQCAWYDGACELELLS